MQGKVDDETGARTLVWLEKGGPEVKNPGKNTGFGTIVIQRVLAANLKGKVDIDYHPKGVRLSLSMGAFDERFGT